MFVRLAKAVMTPRFQEEIKEYRGCKELIGAIACARSTGWP